MGRLSVSCTHFLCIGGIDLRLVALLVVAGEFQLPDGPSGSASMVRVIAEVGVVVLRVQVPLVLQGNPLIVLLAVASMLLLRVAGTFCNL